MPESPCIVARLVGPDTPLPSGYLTFLMEPVPALHPLPPVTMSWVSLIISLIRRLRHVDNKSILLNSLCDESAGDLLRTNHGQEPPRAAAYHTCSIHPSPALFPCTFRTYPSQVGRQYISGSVIVIVTGDLLSGVFLGLERLCEQGNL